MKKELIFIFILTLGLSIDNHFFEIKASSSDKVTLSFSLQDYEFDNNNGYTSIKINDSGTSSLIGEPLLPSLSSFVKLDKNSSYTIDYEIISEKEYLDIEIMPLQNFKNTKNNDLIKNELIYNTSNQYPENNLQISDRQAMRGNEFINIELTPFNYYPSDKKVTVMEEVEITITKNGVINEPLSKDFPKSKAFDRLMNSIVINPTNENRNNDYQQPHILYVCGGNVSSNSYFNQLVKWRQKQGYKVTVVSTSETGSSATDVKDYLEDSMNWDTPPEFVTLVGDVGGSYNIGSFTEYDSDYNGEGDHPFSQLDGADLWPEVILGRISVRSSSETAVVVSKILGYEQAVQEGSWYESAGIVGDPSTSGISCAITAENIAERMTYYGMEDVDLKISGGNYDDYMVDKLQQGVSYLNYRGYYGVSGFSSNDVDNANNGYKLPFATIITCGTGSFASESQCLTEKFLRAGTVTSPRGSVACIGTATLGTHTMFNNAVNIGIYHGIFSQDLQTAGESLVAGKANLYQTYPSNPNNWVKIFTYWNNLMGDAATVLWTGNPVIMDVEHQSTINVGQNFISANVSTNDSPVKDALVTLVDDSIDGFYAQGYTDENGNVILNFDPNQVTESIEITVTKFKHKPYMNTITLSDESFPYADSSTVIEDGTVTVGETLNLNVPIFYNGNETFTNVSGALSSDGYVNIISDTVEYGTIDNNGGESDDSFVVEVTELQDNNSVINFYITLSGQNSSGETVSFVTNLYYTVESFDINILSAEIINDSGGNNPGNSDNGRLDPGETSNLYLAVENTGTISSPNFSCLLTTESEDLSITQNAEVSIVSIEPGNTINTPSFTTINLEDTAFNGEVKILDVSCESDLGFEIISQQEINVGQTTAADPTGPDQYGYYIYDYADSNYSLAPTYDWIDISESGDLLDDVNDDDGDNQDEVEIVDLPFNFGFYGITYDEISVSSNGWISFGRTNMESFRNDHLPGPAGPSPMLAVFWDDLTADSGGQVYSYYDDILNVFIIQWDNVKTYEDNSNESFQAILFDPQFYTTPTGDGEILLQYEDFNNTSNGSYGGGTPQHGGYCSIGIEDHSGEIGIEYTFNDIWARTGTPLSDGTALFISTRKTGTIFNMAQPELELSDNQLNFNIEGEESQSQTITLSNNGEEESILSYNISSSPFSYSEGNDNYGNHWLDSDNEQISYYWVDIDINETTPITFENNDDGQFIDMNFDFKFYGETYNQLIINPNGWVGFGEDNSVWSNGPLPNSSGPQNAVFGFWDDLNPVNSNPTCSNTPEGYVYYKGYEDKQVIWFNNIVRCGSNSDYAANLDFQIVLHKNQRIDINYRDMEGYLTSGTIGIQNSNATDAIEVVYNSTYVQNELTLTFKSVADWINPIYDEQQLDYMQEISYDIIVDGSLIESESETSYLIINSNSSVETQIIPINVEYTDEPSLTGDINGDLIVNILDVVVLVNIVLSGQEYDENADINQDGIINILDVVVLVNIVLNG